MECLVINSNEIEGRLDCHFYRPGFTRLDKKVKSISKKKLADYILSLSGGATPDIKESRKYYSDSTDGVPFLRVQNVTPEGLNLEDVKFINRETHNGLLKRSQVNEYNLLVKITGVGRMAVSSVAPKGFVGNINQHLVVIKTENESTSNVLAVFLNSYIGERLATKRATGGTRPALDYEALKSIPIVFKPEIVSIYEESIIKKKQKESEAQRLLDSINDYVLDELGIKLTSIIEKMCFIAFSEEVKGHRIDPKKYTERPKVILKAIQESKYKNEKLSNLVSEAMSGEWGDDPYNEPSHSSDYILCKVLRNTNFVNKTNLDLTDIAERLINKTKFNKISLKYGDLLIEKSGGSPIQPVGRIALITQINNDYTFSNFLQCLRVNKRICLPEYLFSFLKAIYSLNYMEYIQNQTTGIKNLIMEEFLSIPVCLPPLAVQNKIAEEVKNRMQKAEQLQKEAKDELENAKQEIERIILGA